MKGGGGGEYWGNREGMKGRFIKPYIYMYEKFLRNKVQLKNNKHGRSFPLRKSSKVKKIMFIYFPDLVSIFS